MARDYYEVLGVTRTSTKDDIKKAFRRLARQYHPDVSQEADADKKFKEINEAYEVLSDDQKRARYDAYGHAGVQGAGAGYGGPGGFTATDFVDIFEQFFGGSGGRQRRGPRQGGDIRLEVTIDFLEAVKGIDSKEIEYQRLESCDVCKGSGAEAGSSPTTCPECNGAGEVRRVAQSFIGSVVRVMPCPRCGGKGTIITNPCRNCDGSGRRRKKTSFTTPIYPGVDEGMRIAKSGAGDVGELGAPPGNVELVIHVRPHEFFKRKDNDVILDWNVNIAQAALGDNIRVPTVDGEVDLTIPPGTQTGKSFRLRGKGVPRLRSDGTHSGRGDQMVYISVAVPTKLTTKQRELFEQLAETFGTEVQQSHAGGRGFFERMMDFINGGGNSSE